MAAGPTIIATVGADTAPLQRELKAAANAVSGFGRTINSTLAGLGVFAIIRLGKAIVDFGSDMQDQAESIDMTSEAWQWLSAAFGDDTSAEKVHKAIVKLNQSIDDARNGSKEMMASFKALGVTWEELHTLSPDEILMQIADAARDSKNPTETLAAILATLGKNARTMVPDLKMGSAAIRELGDAASVADSKVTSSLDNMSRSFSMLFRTLKVFGAKAAASIWDDLVELPNKLKRAIFPSPSDNAHLSSPIISTTEQNVPVPGMTPPSPEDAAKLKQAQKDEKEWRDHIKKEREEFDKEKKDREKDFKEQVIKDEKEYRDEIRKTTDEWRRALKERAEAEKAVRAQAVADAIAARQQAFSNEEDRFVDDPSQHGEMERRRANRKEGRLRGRFRDRLEHEQRENDRRARTGAVRHGGAGPLERAENAADKAVAVQQAAMVVELKEIKAKMDGWVKSQ